MSKVRKTSARESDNAYFLKILVFLTLGLCWIKINGLPLIPGGLVVGLIVAQHDHFAIDRKIEYAVMIVGAIIGLFGAIAPLSIWF